jgi:hypothetical protein
VRWLKPVSPLAGGGTVKSCLATPSNCEDAYSKRLFYNCRVEKHCSVIMNMVGPTRSQALNKTPPYRGSCMGAVHRLNVGGVALIGVP